MNSNEGNSAQPSDTLSATDEISAVRFTPLWEGARQDFLISPADSLKLTRGLGYKGEVTDLTSGRRFKVYGTACPAPKCYCDATVIEV